MQLTPDEMQKIGNINFAGLGTAGEGFTNLDFEKISQMSESEYNAFKKALTPEQYDMLMKNPQFRKLYRAADQKRLNPFEF